MVEASASMSLALPCVHNPCCMSQCARRTGLTQHMCCRLGVCCCTWLSCRVLVAGLSSLQTQCCSLGQPPAAKQAQAWAVLPESPLVAKPWSKGTDVAMGCGMVAPAGGAQQSKQDTCACARPLLQVWASSACAHTHHTLLIVDPRVCVMSQHRQVHRWVGRRMHTVSGCPCLYHGLHPTRGVSFGWGMHTSGACACQCSASPSLTYSKPQTCPQGRLHPMSAAVGEAGHAHPSPPPDSHMSSQTVELACSVGFAAV